MEQLNYYEQEWLKCAQSFEYFAGHYVLISHPARGPVPFILYEFQQRVIKEYEGHPLNIISKFRQGGLTTITVIYMLWRCMFKTDETVLFMSKTDREAIKAGKIMTKVLQYLENNHPWLFPVMSENTHHVKTFKETGCSVEFRTIKAARGQSVTWLVIDEAAFIQGMEEAWKDMYPTIATGGRCIVISTVNGHGNWYASVYHDALAKRNTFNVIDLDYTEHPDYRDPEWIRKTKSNMKPREWKQEFERSFLGSGSNYFDDDVVAELEKKTKQTFPQNKLFAEWDSDDIKFEVPSPDGRWEKGAMWVWEPPREGREYILAADVAEGKGSDGDNSTFTILDNATLEQVAEFNSNVISVNNFAQVIAHVGSYYNTALVIVESNSLGNAVIDRLVHNIYYENLYYQQTKANEKAGLNVSHTTRPQILETLADYLDHRLIKINSCRLVQEMLTFRFNASKKRAEAEKGHHDDLIMAMAMAVFVRDRSIRDIPAGADIIEPINESHLTDLHHRIKSELDSITPEDLIAAERKADLLASDGNSLSLFGNITRPFDSLLREFGWAINWFILGGSALLCGAYQNLM